MNMSDSNCFKILITCRQVNRNLKLPSRCDEDSYDGLVHCKHWLFKHMFVKFVL